MHRQYLRVALLGLTALLSAFDARATPDSEQPPIEATQDSAARGLPSLGTTQRSWIFLDLEAPIQTTRVPWPKVWLPVRQMQVWLALEPGMHWFGTAPIMRLSSTTVSAAAIHRLAASR